MTKVYIIGDNFFAEQLGITYSDLRENIEVVPTGALTYDINYTSSPSFTLNVVYPDIVDGNEVAFPTQADFDNFVSEINPPSTSGLTDEELRASPVTVDGIVTATVDTTGLATSAKQDLLLAELENKANLTDTQPVSLASVPLPSGASTSANQDTTNTKLDTIIENTTIIPFNSDAGGRTRVSQITTLLDGKILGADDSDLFQNVGTGTATYANNKVDLSVTAGQYMIRQSKRFCPYFAGKSQLIELTFDNMQLETGIIKRVGYFSSSATAPHTASLDGIYFETNGVTNEYRLITTRQGTETLNLDVTSLVSGYDFANFTVIAFDFLWLGGAVLRFFLKTSNGFELIHQFDYSGTQTDTFILSPNQPIRYEIRSTTGTGSLRYICSQVATEGSINEGGKTLSLYNPTSVTTNAVGTIYALKAIRKQVAFRDTAVQILNIALSNSATTDAGILMLFVNPTLSGAMTYVANSKIEESTNTNRTITAGTGRLVCATPLNVAGSTDIIKENFLSFLSQSITNTFDEFVLAYMPITSNQNVHAVLTVKEY